MAEIWWLFKASTTAVGLLIVLLGIAFAPLWLGLIVEHGDASDLWFLGLPISLIPTFMLVCSLDRWDPPWL